MNNKAQFLKEQKEITKEVENQQKPDFQKIEKPDLKKVEKVEKLEI